ncbi:MerR family transcriptional regulator [Leeia sp.]|uniref:MerR family transcriptional regulator n=1 Tax=Leeia sp. TaxID=2884678 RepID=UPI0035B1A510
MNAMYSIQDISAQTGLSAHTLRYYERIGLLGPVPRAPGGQRRYREDDLHWLAFLQRLRVIGMPIREMQTYARLRQSGDSTLAQRRTMLEQYQTALLERIGQLQQSAHRLDEKIAHYRRLELAITATGDPNHE